MTMISSATSATTPRSCVIMITAELKSSFNRSEQLHDLSLDRHVERGRRLVGDQDVRVAPERHRDHRALPHPAGELVRKVVDARFRVRDPDLAKQLDGPVLGAALSTLSWIRIASAI